MELSIWERPEPSGRPTPLSRDAIVRAAIALADEAGLEAVSFRKVAAALGAGPMRLYGYVATKEDLLDLMLDAVYAETAGASDVRALARALWSTALRHEWMADLLGGRPVLGPNALAHLEAMLAALTAGDRDLREAVTAARAVTAYVTGAIRTEVARRRAERLSGLDEPARQAASGPYLQRMLDTGRYPTVARFVTEYDEPGAESEFDAGLAVVMWGVVLGGGG